MKLRLDSPIWCAFFFLFFFSSLLVYNVAIVEMKFQLLSILLTFCIIQCCNALYEPSHLNDDEMMIYTIPPPTIVNSMLDSNHEKSYRFAHSIPTSISIQTNDSSVHVKDNTWRLIIKIQSRNALSLSLIFDRWWIPKGSKAIIYNDKGVSEK